jgi:hypothetical protein
MTLRKSTDRESEQLDLVRALSSEITAAISALEKNDLHRLQAAIAAQERICHQMVVRKSLPVAPGTSDTDLLRAAYAELAQLNRVYAGVIKRSKRCADLLLALYGSCGIGYGKDLSGSSAQQSLTCEV